MKFELLDTQKHDRKAFDCGIDALNAYLQRVANQDQKRNLAKTYVLAHQNEIIGYCSLCTHSVSKDQMPENESTGIYSSVPFLLLGRLAIDKKHQKRGYGEALIFHAFKITAEIAEKVGVQGIIVDAKDEKAVLFYEKFGFHRLKSSTNRLMLTLAAIKKNDK